MLIISFRGFERNRMARYTATEIASDKLGIVRIEGKSYLLVLKNDMIDHRVSSISYR